MLKFADLASKHGELQLLHVIKRLRCKACKRAPRQSTLIKMDGDEMTVRVELL